MFKSRSKHSLLALVAASGAWLFTAMSAYSAEAGYGGVLRINAEGKRLCKQYEASGGTYWSGKVRGRFEDGFGGFTDRFTVRTCFTSSAACQTFLNRIHHKVFPVEQIYFSRCKIES